MNCVYLLFDIAIKHHLNANKMSYTHTHTNARTPLDKGEASQIYRTLSAPKLIKNSQLDINIQNKGLYKYTAS